MRRRSVDSSAVSSIGYDERSSVLEVEFEGGAVYDYFDVPAKVYKDLLEASSIGRFVSLQIRDQYPFARRDH
jgi:hypothetical protein